MTKSFSPQKIKTLKKTIKLFKATLTLALIVLFIPSCIVAPVNSHYESARSLQKNNIEATGSFTNYSYAEEGVESINNNVGLRLGYGITDNFDVKLQYQWMSPSDNAIREDIGGVHFMSFAPKYTFIDNILALKVPFNYYTYTSQDGSDNAFSLNPTLIGTYPVNQHFEFGLATSYQIIFKEEQDFLGFALGFGFSKDLDQWAIRPELGYQLSLSNRADGFVNFGFGFTYNFDLNQ